MPGQRNVEDFPSKPENCVLLTKKEAGKSSSEKSENDEGQIKTNIEKPSRPSTMAEAVAAYTGKKYLTKAEKNRSRKQSILPQKRQIDSEEEDVGEDIDIQTLEGKVHSNEYVNNVPKRDSDSPSDSNYESASEYQPLVSSDVISKSNDSLLSPNEKGASLQDTQPFDNSRVNNCILHYPKGNKNEKDETISNITNNNYDDNNNDDDDDSFHDFDSEGSSGGDSEESSAEEENSDKLRNDIRGDLYPTSEDSTADIAHSRMRAEGDPKEEKSEDVHSRQTNTAKETKEELSLKQKEFKTSSLPQFYAINELYNSRGTNNSDRIYKNWRELSGFKPTGLLNHGVTCYMNSAIQALLHVPAIQHYLNDVILGKHKDTIKNRSVTVSLAELSKKMWGLDGDNKRPKYVNPKKIIQRLHDINCMMSEWEQEDSHEYYMSLVSRLQEDSTPKGVKLNQSIIYDILGGLLRQLVTCKNCGNISETKQEFYDVSLGLNKKKHKDSSESVNNLKYTIEKSFKDFFSNELIKFDGKDKSSGYYCEKCGKRTNAYKRSTIDRSPETLTVHLKRFKFDGVSSSKVKQSISYPKFLDLTEFTSDNTSTRYQLISVIVHEGRSILSGHYIAHCLQPDNTWATYDDEFVNRIDEYQALRDPSAYVLVYTKLTPKSTKTEANSDYNLPNRKRQKTQKT